MIIIKPGVPMGLLPDSARLPCRSLSDSLGWNWPGSKTELSLFKAISMFQAKNLFKAKSFFKAIVFSLQRNWFQK